MDSAHQFFFCSGFLFVVYLDSLVMYKRIPNLAVSHIRIKKTIIWLGKHLENLIRLLRKALCVKDSQTLAEAPRTHLIVDRFKEFMPFFFPNENLTKNMLTFLQYPMPYGGAAEQKGYFYEDEVFREINCGGAGTGAIADRMYRPGSQQFTVPNGNRFRADDRWTACGLLHPRGG